MSEGTKEEEEGRGTSPPSWSPSSVNMYRNKTENIDSDGPYWRFQVMSDLRTGPLK